MRNDTENRFKVDDLEFEQLPLSFKQQNATIKLLTRSVLPLVFGMKGRASSVQFVEDAVKTTDYFEELVDAFAKACTFKYMGAKVALPEFLDQAFGRNTVGCLEWLVTCICWQFEDFLSETGQNRVEAMANRLESLFGPKKVG